MSVLQCVELQVLPDIISAGRCDRSGLQIRRKRIQHKKTQSRKTAVNPLWHAPHVLSRPSALALWAGVKRSQPFHSQPNASRVRLAPLAGAPPSARPCPRSADRARTALPARSASYTSRARSGIHRSVCGRVSAVVGGEGAAGAGEPLPDGGRRPGPIPASAGEPKVATKIGALVRAYPRGARRTTSSRRRSSGLETCCSGRPQAGTDQRARSRSAACMLD